MKNNRGQTIVVFVLFLPLLILFSAYVYDTVNANYEKNRIQNLANTAVNTEKDIDGVRNVIRKNDENININITESDGKYKIELSKKVKIIFGKIVGRDYYDVRVYTEK